MKKVDSVHKFEKGFEFFAKRLLLAFMGDTTKTSKNNAYLKKFKEMNSEWGLSTV